MGGTYTAWVVILSNTMGNSKLYYFCLCVCFLHRLMVLQNRLAAMGVFNVYTQTHPTFRNEAGPPYKEYPLVNFIWFLLLASEKSVP